MANYTPVTNFLSKDSLVSGNALKALKGAELSTEFAAVQTAVNSKPDGAVSFFPDGSNTQPSIGFTNNAGTGIYNVAGALAFATGATLRLSISASGTITAANLAITPAGNLTLTAPTSGIALTINPFAGSYAVRAIADTAIIGWANTANATVGVIGTVKGVTGAGATTDTGLSSTGGLFLYSNNSTNPSLQIDTSGVVSIPDALAGTMYPAGYKNIPQKSISGSYTPILSDAGKYFDCAASTAVTLPTNGSVPYQLGTAITMLGDFGSGSFTVAAGAGETLYWAGQGALVTGTRTVGIIGLVTVLRISTTQWVISGAGIS